MKPYYEKKVPYYEETRILNQQLMDKNDHQSDKQEKLDAASSQPFPFDHTYAAGN